MTPSVRRLLGPGAMVLAMLIALLGLGTWQVHRLTWKQDILDRVAAAEAQPPLPLTENPPNFAKVAVTGTFRHDQTARFGYFVQNARIGSHLIVPLEREGAPTVLVNRGWVPTELPSAIDRPEGQVTVVGFIRPPDTAGLFSATDDLAARQFYTLDAGAIGRTLGLISVAPYILVAVGPPPPARWPEPAKALPRPPNNHLSYAIVWYGLAVSLLVIFFVWVRKGAHA